MDLATAIRCNEECKDPTSIASSLTATPIKEALDWLITEHVTLQSAREQGRREGREEAFGVAFNWWTVDGKNILLQRINALNKCEKEG